MRRELPTYAHHASKAVVLARPEAEQLSLSLERSIEPLEQQWRALERQCHSTLYQSWIWCKAWLDTVAKSNPVDVRIVVIKSASGEAAGILPLQIRRQFGIRVLEWLGAPHITYGHGLFCFGQSLTPEWLKANWPRIVTLAGPADATFLAEMPAALRGQAHPLKPLFNFTCPNRSYRMALAPNYESLLKSKRSAETMRQYRKRDRAFAGQGRLEFGLPQTRAEVHATLATMFYQQEARLAEHGVHGVFGHAERQFIHRLAELQDSANPILVPFALKFQGEIQAVMLGGLFDNTYWALISSLAGNNLRKYSPGDLALRRTIEACCAQGLSSFDFATGDSEYKSHWADESVELHGILAAANLRGLAWAIAVWASLGVKRAAKQWPVSRRAFNAVRKAFLGKSFRP